MNSRISAPTLRIGPGSVSDSRRIRFINGMRTPGEDIRHVRNECAMSGRCAPICRTVVVQRICGRCLQRTRADQRARYQCVARRGDPAGAIGAAAATRTYPQARASARDTPDRRSRRKASSPTAGFGWSFALAIPQKRRRNLTRPQPALRSQRIASSASMTGLARGSAHMGHQTKNLNIVLVLFEKQIKSVASNSINCPKFR